ncbi:MAG TPA: RpiB/LacA/LacB family sugar-phosphate isomerase [Candidatus Saccharimonadales bacterium]|nr:RpiB/LacA/LacB family sugar-phosphate isomerase [Candidatus Saccharimonadales bacterium]
MIYLATDHAGFELKEKVKAFLTSSGHEVIDCGADTFNPDDDYPDFIAKAAQGVSKDPDNSKAIIFGKSGQGEAIVANKVKGIRAVVYYGGNSEIIKLSRDHNDANVLSIGAGFVSENEAQSLIEEWLGRKFSNEERHSRRINKIKEIENNG